MSDKKKAEAPKEKKKEAPKKEEKQAPKKVVDPVNQSQANQLEVLIAEHEEKIESLKAEVKELLK